jgi:hypothetical protein
MPASITNLIAERACYIHPAGGRVLIVPTETPDEISHGTLNLVIPDQAKDPYPTEGTVIDVGPDVPLVPKIGKDGLPEKDEHG